MAKHQTQVTRLLRAAGEGDGQAAADVLPLVYDELRRLAEAWMSRAPPGQTLQPTALVHEAFLRLIGRTEERERAWEDQKHFFFAAGRAMRDILVERARAKGRLKRGGERRRVELDGLVLAVDAPWDDLIRLDEVLAELEAEHPWESRLVTLRFFAGLTNEQTARVMDAPLRTIERDWRFAKAWLRRKLDASQGRPG